jgi:hypothetical protein
MYARRSAQSLNCASSGRCTEAESLSAEIHPALRKVAVYSLIAHHQADPGNRELRVAHIHVSANAAAASAKIRAYDFTLM